VNLDNIIRYVCSKSDCASSSIDLVALWTFSLVIATLLLVVATLFLWRVSYKQLGGISKTTRADFIERFSNKFFNSETRVILMLLDYKTLLFKSAGINYGHNVVSKDFLYFEIDEQIAKQLIIDSKSLSALMDKKVYSAFELDDLLLGYFEDIGALNKQGLLEIKDVYNYFNWYIENCWENPEIQKYILQQRHSEGEGIYENFEHIYRKCCAYGVSEGRKKKVLTYIKYMFP